MNQDDFINAFRGANLNAEQLYQQYFGTHQSQAGFNTYDPFARLGAQVAAQVLQSNIGRIVQPTADPETRKDQINHELDIIRGIVPTPKGYIVNPLRVKALMAELKKLA